MIKSTLTTEQRNTKTYICDGDIFKDDLKRYQYKIDEFLKILYDEIFEEQP